MNPYRVAFSSNGRSAARVSTGIRTTKWSPLPGARFSVSERRFPWRKSQIHRFAGSKQLKVGLCNDSRVCFHVQAGVKLQQNCHKENLFLDAIPCYLREFIISRVLQYPQVSKGTQIKVQASATMESCVAVEKEIDRVINKFTAINEHSSQVIGDVVNHIEELKNHIAEGKAPERYFPTS